MVTNRKQHSSQRPVKQGRGATAPQPNKIGASTPYNFRGKNLTPYGGLLPVATLLEKLDFQALVEETLSVKRITRVMSLYQFVLALVLGLYVGFARLNQLRFIARDPILTGILKVTRLPPQSTLWRFLASLHLNVAPQMLSIQRQLRERVWAAAQVKLETVTLDTDTTVHTLYGRQMGGRKSYNPKNKGKRSYQPILTFLTICRRSWNSWLDAIVYLAPMGRLDEAIEQMRVAEEIDPLSPFHCTIVGWALYLAGRYAEAIEQCRKALRLGANFHLAHLVKGWAYEQKSGFEEALDSFENARSSAGSIPLVLGSLAHCHALGGETKEATKLLDDLKGMSTERYVPPLEIAVIYAGLRETDLALEWLNKAYVDRTPRLTLFRVDPRFDSLRAQPEFTTLINKMGLSAAAHTSWALV